MIGDTVAYRLGELVGLGGGSVINIASLDTLFSVGLLLSLKPCICAFKVLQITSSCRIVQFLGIPNSLFLLDLLGTEFEELGKSILVLLLASYIYQTT